MSYLAPDRCLNEPHRLRSTRGPRSRYFSGSQVCQTWGGSTTWSSTLMILANAMAPGYRKPATSVRLGGPFLQSGLHQVGGTIAGRTGDLARALPRPVGGHGPGSVISGHVRRTEHRRAGV